jgi:hypothetical protein
MTCRWSLSRCSQQSIWYGYDRQLKKNAEVEPRPNRRVHAFALFMACCAFPFLIARALVTSDDARLAIAHRHVESLTGLHDRKNGGHLRNRLCTADRPSSVS